MRFPYQTRCRVLRIEYYWQQTYFEAIPRDEINSSISESTKVKGKDESFRSKSLSEYISILSQNTSQTAQKIDIQSKTDYYFTHYNNSW